MSASRFAKFCAVGITRLAVRHLPPAPYSVLVKQSAAWGLYGAYSAPFTKQNRRLLFSGLYPPIQEHVYNVNTVLDAMGAFHNLRVRVGKRIVARHGDSQIMGGFQGERTELVVVVVNASQGSHHVPEADAGLRAWQLNKGRPAHGCTRGNGRPARIGRHLRKGRHHKRHIVSRA